MTILGVILSGAAAASPEPDATTDLTQLPLEALMNIEVYSASKFTQKITEAPAAVSIVTAMDIKAYGYRVNGALYDTASSGQEFFLEVDLIERVEVVRGPGSSIYGSNAFFGVVNVITRRGEGIDGWQVAGEATSHDAGKWRLTYGKRYEKGADWLFSASYADGRGRGLFFPEFNAPATNNGVAQNLDHELVKQLYGRLAFGNYSVAAAYAERVKGVPTAPYSGVLNDPRIQTTDSQAVLDLDYYGQPPRRATSGASWVASRMPPS